MFVIFVITICVVLVIISGFEELTLASCKEYTNKIPGVRKNTLFVSKYRVSIFNLEQM